ncbi:MAG: antibiotic biosynthesis monooxygenase [Victivallaceae bacterium]|nr:antibiotic biosynthesis monooxygenase [Victivallaceae bacterium]
MVNVIARMEIKPHCMDAFLDVLLANAQIVRTENGCLRYDVCRDLEIKDGNDNFVTILETWESESALRAHQQTPHMQSYREKVRDLRLHTTVNVLRPAEKGIG